MRTFRRRFDRERITMRRQISDTQRESWKEIRKSLGEMQQRVFEIIQDYSTHGATLFEVCKRLGKPPNEVSGRVTELCDARKIRDSGERRCNPRTRKKGIVYVVC